MFFKKRKEDNIQDAIERNPELLLYIQSRGGISFRDERIVKTGDGYEVCVHIYAYPGDYKVYWLSELTNRQNVVTTIDVSSLDINKVKQNISKSIDENESRYAEARHYSEKKEADNRVRRLSILYDEIDQLGEVVKITHIRVYLFNSVLDELEKNLEKLLADLNTSNYGAIPFLNESKKEYCSMFQSYDKQKYTNFPSEGIQITGENLAKGLPFYFSSLRDPMGTHLGYTSCNGAVLFDYFQSDRQRKSYNGIVAGAMGSGKSTLLKKIFLDRASRGDYVRAFDITGEFRYLAREYGGRIVKLDGSEGRINLLEILKTDIEEGINFQNHISKLHTIYGYWNPDASNHEKIMFEEVLYQLYSEYNLLPDDNQITGLPAKAYPTLSDLLVVIEKKMDLLRKKKNAADIQSDILTLNNIAKSIGNIVNTYGSIFNGISTLEKFTSEQIVVFDISTIKDIKNTIFDSLIFNAITLCWDGGIQNGSLYKEMYDNRQIGLDEVIHTLIIVDESHRWINTKKLHALDLIKNFLREGRKWFMGMLLATQSIRDFVPEGNTLGIDELKVIFELCQYKFIFRHDSNALPIIKNSFGSEMTLSELESIPFKEEGSCVMVISGVRNLDLDVWVTNEELFMFKGGA